MADLKSQFEQAAKDVKSLAERPDNDTMLRLYAPVQAGLRGRCAAAPSPASSISSAPPSTKPGKSSRAPSQDEAMKKYVDLVKKLAA